MAQSLADKRKNANKFSTPLGTTPTKTLMNADAAPLGFDMISIRVTDTHILKPGECTVFISPKYYLDINGIVLGLLMNLRTKLYTPICAWQIKPGKSSKNVLFCFLRSHKERQQELV